MSTINLGGVRERSLAVNVDYVLDTDKYGTFTIDTTGAIFLSYKFQALPTQPFYEYAGTATNGGTGVQGTLPKYRFYTSVDWAFQGWDVTVGNTFISSVEDLGVGGQTRANNIAAGTALPPYHVSAYTAWDIRVQKEFELPGDSMLKKWTLAAGINDFTNALPPLSPLAFTDNNADVSTYSPIGRLFYVSGSAKF
jgi:iron complex outermembrane receptor protein